jgi:alpha/beta superfamily hydrolase
VPQPHTERIHRAAASRDKTLRTIPGATHYYAGQAELLRQAVDLCAAWMEERHLTP